MTNDTTFNKLKNYINNVDEIVACDVVTGETIDIILKLEAREIGRIEYIRGEILSIVPDTDTTTLTVLRELKIGRLPSRALSDRV
jgi:DNA-binding Lrp family transcriptional regulator